MTIASDHSGLHWIWKLDVETYPDLLPDLDLVSECIPCPFKGLGMGCIALTSNLLPTGHETSPDLDMDKETLTGFGILH